ncbi:MAG: hypothetical protein JNL85_10060 [Rubrivivax sp.]|nr:hypothetical protein [Rubrivivax sp.]
MNTMNTMPNPRAATQRLSAFALALLMTVAMLATVDHLATSDAPAAQLARSEAGTARS